jgi:hypothetical protein
MYLHTRLLFGIGTVTLAALVISLLLPLESVRSDVARETDASMQLAQLLLDVQHAVGTAGGSAAARLAATNEIRRAHDLRHVRVSLVDDAGRLLATSPAENPQVGRITRALLSSSPPATLTYPVAYHAVPLGVLRVSSNPMSEFAEIEQRVAGDFADAGASGPERRHLFDGAPGVESDCTGAGGPDQPAGRQPRDTAASLPHQGRR